jgi:hypothetical protein
VPGGPVPSCQTTEGSLMSRVRALAIGVVAVFAMGACGSSTSPRSAPTTKNTPSTYPDGMTAAQMAHMKAAVVPPKALAVLADGDFDPTKINLGGVPGVSPAEQKSAENLLRETVDVLPHWASTATAAAEGFHPIGDALTGDEHWIHWDWIEDKDYLDPHKPEALVYHVDQSTQKRTLEAVMFILPKQFNFNNLPDVGGKLLQFHIHDNLCFTDSTTAPQVAGISFSGTCGAGLVKFHPNVMVHVWIRPNPCGPFAALEGVGAGQVKPGQTRACDEMHGSSL